jgi:serine protein kinase
MLAAIGEPTLVDTRNDTRLSRIFANKVIKIYPAFREFYGTEEVIEQVVSYFRHAAQGLEERKQILSAGAGGRRQIIDCRKTQIADGACAVLLPERFARQRITAGPVQRRRRRHHTGRRLRHTAPLSAQHPRPWAVKRLHEFNGDINQFRVVKRYPSVLKQGHFKTEPGDENNQDISSLVGKVDIRKLEDYSQDDPDAYSYSGGLCLANQGLMEFVEMFKAPIKVLHPC